MKKSSYQNHAELSNSIGLGLAIKNREKGHGSFTKISDFAIHWTLLMHMFMSISFFMVNFYQSNKRSSNLLHRNSLESNPRATVMQEKLNS